MIRFEFINNIIFTEVCIESTKITQFYSNY